MIKLRNPDIRSIFGAFTLFTQNSEHFPKIGLSCSSGTKNFFPVQQEAVPTYTCLGILSVGNLPRPAPDSCALPFSDMARTRVNISLGLVYFIFITASPIRGSQFVCAPLLNHSGGPSPPSLVGSWIRLSCAPRHHSATDSSRRRGTCPPPHCPPGRPPSTGASAAKPCREFSFPGTF